MLGLFDQTSWNQIWVSEHTPLLFIFNLSTLFDRLYPVHVHFVVVFVHICVMCMFFSQYNQ